MFYQMHLLTSLFSHCLFFFPIYNTITINMSSNTNPPASAGTILLSPADSLTVLLTKLQSLNLAIATGGNLAIAVNSTDPSDTHPESVALDEQAELSAINRMTVPEWIKYNEWK